MTTQRTVGILVFPDVEVLDFCGPFEVFSVAGPGMEPRPFTVRLIATEPGPIRAVNGLSVNPDYTMDTAPQPEILLVPGGIGTRPLLDRPDVLAYVGATAAKAELVLSVCTGSLVLAKAGLLEGLSATTHWLAYDLLESIAPNTTVKRDQRVVDNGRIVCSAGVSAGIDMSFHILSRLIGDEAARKTAHYIEWPYGA